MQPFVSNSTAWLYRQLLKPLFFQLDPEFVHNAMTHQGKLLGYLPPARTGIAWAWGYQHPRLQSTLDGITFPNPVGLSAGFDYNGELTQILGPLGFGFHTIGTVTLLPYQGNTKPRLGRLPKSQGLLVNKGLKSLGAAAVIAKLEPLNFPIPVGISIASTNRAYANSTEQINDILQCFQAFENSQVKHSYYELNISCPNTFGGEPFTSCARLETLLKKIDRLSLSRPLYAKMPIDPPIEDKIQLMKVLEKHNVQGIIIGNLTKDKNNPAIHPTERSLWQHRAGNVSGKPTWDRSNALIAAARATFKKRFTIIGVGGVFSGKDAQEKINHGADLVQLITGMIYEGPQLIGQINAYLASPTNSHQRHSSRKIKSTK